MDVISGIKAETLNSRDLTIETRQDCVQYLSAEGMTVPEIAKVLGVSGRTIARDRTAIQEANAIVKDPKLSGLFAGRLQTEAMTCIERIRRVTRDKDAPHSVKVEGERVCFQIYSELIQRLQSLGYLLTATQQVQAELTHKLGELMSLEQIQGQSTRLLQIQQDEEIDVDTTQDVNTSITPQLPAAQGE